MPFEATVDFETENRTVLPVAHFLHLLGSIATIVRLSASVPGDSLDRRQLHGSLATVRPKVIGYHTCVPFHTTTRQMFSSGHPYSLSQNRQDD